MKIMHATTNVDVVVTSRNKAFWCLQSGEVSVGGYGVKSIL